MRVFVAAVGALIVLADLVEVVRALVVPRATGIGPATSVIVLLRRMTHAAAAHLRDFDTRDRYLAIVEPTFILVRLVVWLAIGVVGFAFVIWGVSDAAFGHCFIDSGSSVFTLGFATEPGTVPSVVVFLAAAFGLILVALQIAYLPALYDAFNRRETLVTMLESRAGTPAWGPELLARHYLVGIEGNLPAFYAEWERWAADVSESHTTYPTLLRLRSPHATNSWLVGLIAVCDSAALYLALSPQRAPAEARLCVRMGFTALRDIARVMKIPFDPDPLPDAGIALGYDEFLYAVERMQRAGVPMERPAAEAWPHFVGWRVNYESIAYALADEVFAPPALWTGVRRHDEALLAPRRPVDRRPDMPQGAPSDTAP
ncbi:MAG: hypothetical protein ACYDA2_09795 [Acidimicrobiales bacterium]